MNTMPNSTDQPGRADRAPATGAPISAPQIVRVLRHRYGLPVQLLAGRPTIVTGSILGALVMPADLGRRVLASMDRSHAAPVIAEPGERSWTFLVTPPTPARPVEVPIRRSLTAHRVTVLPGGHHITLPTTLDWHWAGEPATDILRLPPRIAVIDAIHRVVAVRTAAS